MTNESTVSAGADIIASAESRMCEKNSSERQSLNRQLAQMLKGGVIMDVTTPEQARIAEEAGACAVMALERIPADIRAAGGVSRMSDPKMIRGIQEAVSIPVMAK
jgi:pyridoxal 5'-phosphate synthase pdxS subunit